MKKKILIIEDESAILYGLQANFIINGFEVEILKDEGSIAVFATEIIKQKPNYIIIGLPLTKTAKFELLESIKSNLEIMHIPVIIYTYNDDESEEKYQKAGADYFFLKSELNIHEFVEKITKIINNKSR